MSLISRALSCSVALCAAASLNANVLMLDFGPTTISGDALTNSPYHTVNGSYSGTVWNEVQTSDIPAGSLRWANGMPAETVSVEVGATTNPKTTVLGLHFTPGGSHALSTSVNSGIYEGASAATDAIFTGTKHGHSRAVGVQVNGLPAGTYDVYVMARNTNTDKRDQRQHVHVGTTPQPGDFDFTANDFTSKELVYPTQSDATTTWVENENYAKFTVTLAEGASLNVATRGGNAVEQRGFLNCIQIVLRADQPAASEAQE